MTTRPAVPATTVARQQRATDPAASAWVRANAGSGKTHVLVERVVRLLVAGTPPARLLCITFTRAAAAEMAARVFRRLAEFATMADADLDRALAALDPETAPTAEGRAAARRLFARALESPGGLKIQTIHAFCAALLSRFPLEANVSGRFEVLDDHLAAELAEEALAELLAEAARDPGGPIAAAIAALQPMMGDDDITTVVRTVIAERQRFAAFLEAAAALEGGDPVVAAITLLSRRFGLAPGEDAAAVEERMLAGRLLAGEALAGLAASLAAGGKTAAERAADIAEAGDVLLPATERAAAWRRLLFTAKGEPRAFDKALTKAVAARHVALVDAWLAEQTRVAALENARVAATAVAATAALFRLAGGVLDRVEAEKRRRCLIDYDDQIARAAGLLSRAEASEWVRFKLDQGIDHILVDEAQDTSPEPWEIVRRLAAEFFAGEGARGVRRTLFAVGDEKQSIYSFQGAAPELFAEARQRFSTAAGAVGEAFHDVELTLSFRSTAEVLAAVDAVFAAPETHAGLSHPPAATAHQALRTEPGIVEIWPTEEHEDAEEPEDWTVALDHVSSADPRLRLAERIARTIAGWIASGEPLADGRPMRAGDVLVLFRRRGPIVEALGRALKRLGVAVAGADRLTLGEHIAAEDLIALGRWLVTPEDDLSLAAVLRSPLFDIDEATLFDLAHGRDGTLAAALAASADPAAAAAHARLARWRTLAARARPFELYAAILGRDGGRRRFLARLGGEVEEVLDAFLDQTLAYERGAPPTLQGFLAWFAAAPVELKREAESRATEVRLMTVHGAKGLESPVVFLVDDGGRAQHASHDPKLLEVDLPEIEDTGLLWAPTKAMRPPLCEEVLARHRRRAAEEHRRLLYVAMTRAADRLVVASAAAKNGLPPDSWARTIEAALVPDSDEIHGPDGALIAWRYRGPARPPAPQGEAKATDASTGPTTAPTAAATLAASMPGWTALPAAAPPVLPERLTPSAAAPAAGGAAAEAAGEVDATRVRAALERGRLVHRLIEILAGLAPEERRARALRYAETTAGGDPAAAHAAAAEALAVLAAPEFARLFEGEGRSEVAVAATLAGADGRPRSIAGRIDRLALAPGRVVIVDVKTDRRVPPEAAAVAPAYVAQLALYRAALQQVFPDRAVEAALVYSAGPRLIALPAALLDAALAEALAGSGDP